VCCGFGGSSASTHKPESAAAAAVKEALDAGGTLEGLELSGLGGTPRWGAGALPLPWVSRCLCSYQSLIPFLRRPSLARGGPLGTKPFRFEQLVGQVQTCVDGLRQETGG
jgi:hypothetical protein